MRLKFLDIAKFHGSLAWGGQKSQIWAKFNSTQFFLFLPNFMVHITGVVENLKFKPHFKRDSNFLILPNFMVWRTRVIKILQFEPNL